MECKKLAGGWTKPKLSDFGSEEEMEESSVIPEPETPNESMEFLSRSWSISSEEISRALANNHSEKHHSSSFYHHTPSHVVERATSLTHSKRISRMGKWFHHHHHHHKDHGSLTKKKDMVRAENAHVHAFVSVASLSAALAAVCAAEESHSGGSKMARAVASAAELLASRCIEMAEQAGAPHPLLTSNVASAVAVANPGHLITLTAAAATALRAEATLSSRLPKEAKRNAAISPYDKSFTDAHSIDPFVSIVEEMSPPSPCVGDLMHHTTNGVLRLKRVSVYINKKSQVMIKLKSKHVGGAFSKKDKCLVYGVSDEMSSSEVENASMYFGVQTGQGLLAFKCTNKAHKQHWVDAIGRLLCRQETGHSFHLNKLH